jgi:hypothetical protein
LALGQFREAIVETMDQQGNNMSSEDYSTFAYVQRGTHVGIFEYHNTATILDEEGVPNKGGEKCELKRTYLNVIFYLQII